MLIRLAQLPVLIFLACIVAGLFGALHNQISYTVGPSYFTEMKFSQFQIPPEFQNRIGAGVVGVLASWWMGLILGIVIGIFTLFTKTPAQGRVLFRTALWTVVGSAVTCALGGLILAYVAGDQLSGLELAQRVPEAHRINWLRAALMHEGAYFGAGLGMVIAIPVALRGLLKS